jgi:hypothetical protein
MITKATNAKATNAKTMTAKATATAARPTGNGLANIQRVFDAFMFNFSFAVETTRQQRKNAKTANHENDNQRR